MNQTDSVFDVNDRAFICQTAAEGSENIQQNQPETSSNAMRAQIDLKNGGLLVLLRGIDPSQTFNYSSLFQIRLLIVCCLLGRVWNRPFVLVCVLFARAVEQRRSSLQLFVNYLYAPFYLFC